MIIGGTQIITNKRKPHLFYKIIHFSVQFSAIVNRFIVLLQMAGIDNNHAHPDTSKKLARNAH